MITYETFKYIGEKKGLSYVGVNYSLAFRYFHPLTGFTAVYKNSISHHLIDVHFMSVSLIYVFGYQ